MKVCGTCREEKDLDSFYVRRIRDREIRQSVCKACSSKRHKKYYKTRKKAYIDSSERWRQRRLELVHTLKSKPCMDCGNTFHPIAMDYDHRPDEEKEFSVGNGTKIVSLEKLMAEIAKCDLVCSNCHRIRTLMRTRK